MRLFKGRSGRVLGRRFSAGTGKGALDAAQSEPFEHSSWAAQPRFRGRGGQVRVFYFIKKAEAIYLVHAMKKKNQALPKEDGDLILRRLRKV